MSERKLSEMTKDEIMQALREEFTFVPQEARELTILATIIGMIQ